MINGSAFSKLPVVGLEFFEACLDDFVSRTYIKMLRSLHDQEPVNKEVN